MLVISIYLYFSGNKLIVMKNKELFDRTIGILVNAYFNNTLQHSNCYACAVGNLVAANIGVKGFTEDFTGKFIWRSVYEPEWDEVHCCLENRGQIFHEDRYSGLAKFQIDSTGYSWRETAKIESAFESVKKRDDNDGFLGLMAVVDVLIDIHNGSEDERKEAKQMFVRNAS